MSSFPLKTPTKNAVKTNPKIEQINRSILT
jgi:hypothetical protein